MITKLKETAENLLNMAGWSKQPVINEGKKLHVFIDGSWLFKACGPNRVLADKTVNPEIGVQLDFSRLNSSLLAHIQQTDNQCKAIGNLYLSTSIFTIPNDFDRWPDQYGYVLPEHLEKTKRSVFKRNQYVQSAIDAGYSEEAVYRPHLKAWILKKLMQNEYQEKQVDATVVALLVRSAIINPQDYHCVITGDSDILPAVNVAYPEYSKNVFVATSHHDELKAEHRQTAYSISSFKFDIPAYYFQDHLVNIVQGEHAYHCVECNKVFSRRNPFSKNSRPRCVKCNPKKS